MEAQGLQNANLGPLLADHPGHGGDAHQNGNHNKEYRQEIGNTGNNGGVVFKAYKARVLPPGQYIGVRLIQVRILGLLLFQAVGIQNVVKPVLGHLRQNLGHLGLIGVHQVLVVLGIDVRLGPEGHIHLGVYILVLRKGVGAQVEKALQRAVPDGGGAPVRAQVQRGVRKARDQEAVLLQKIQGVVVIFR